MRNQLKINPVPCTACLSCVMACSQYHKNATGSEYSALQLIVDPFNGDHHFNHCRQCVEALCAAACPVHSISWAESFRAWVLNPETCIHCGRCVDACPFDALPWPDHDDVPIKCDLCEGDPECVKACHFGVLTFEPDISPSYSGIPKKDLDPGLGKE